MFHNGSSYFTLIFYIFSLGSVLFFLLCYMFYNLCGTNLKKKKKSGAFKKKCKCSLDIEKSHFNIFEDIDSSQWLVNLIMHPCTTLKTLNLQHLP